jgi:hypothetical protein
MAGNGVFMEPVMNYARKEFRDPAKTFPLLEPLFAKSKHPLLQVHQLLDIYPYTSRFGFRPHTSASINAKVGIPYYDRWKEVVLGAPFPKKTGMQLLTATA